MSAPTAGKHRRDIDLLKLIEKKHHVTILEGSHEICVRFYGPGKTPYEGGIWNVRIHLTESYPFKSPSVGFMNRIFHPNIDEDSGSVCMNVLNSAWTPVYDLSIIVETFLPQLLAEPNPEDPLNRAAASLYVSKPEEYKLIVQQHISKFASQDIFKSGNFLPSSDTESLSSLSDNDS